VSRHVEVLRVT